MTPSPASHHTIWALTDSISLQARRVLTVLFGLLLALGIYNGYRVCAYGLGFADEPFHIINAMDPLNSPLTVLNGIIGGAFGNTFGWGLIGFRYFAWTLSLVAFLTCGLLFFWKTRDLLATFGITSIMVFFESLARLVPNLYGWDCMVLAIISLIACLSLYYVEKRSLGLLVFISALCGIATLVKVTNIALVVLLPMFFFMKNRRIWDVAIFVVINLAIFIGGLLLIFGSIESYIVFLRMNSNHDHGSTTALLQYMITSGWYVLPLATFYLAQCKLVRKFFHLTPLLLCGMTLALTFANIFTLKVECHIFQVHLLYMVAGVAFAVCAICISKSWIIGLFIFLISYFPALGSNTGTVKYGTVISIILSLAYIVNKNNIRTTAILAIVFAVSFSYLRINDTKYTTFQDSGMPSLTARVNHDRLTGILTTKAHADKIEQAVSLVDGQKTFIVGDSITKYLYEYLFESINPYLRQGFGKKDNFAKQWYVDSICGNISRADKGMQYLYLSTDTTTAMYTALDSLLTEKARGDYAIIFVKD